MPYRNEKGEIGQAAIFVAVLGASNMTFAYATGSQGLADWLEAHVKAFEFFGGVPDVLVPDNLKSGVTHACVFEPEINSSYLELARHYQTAVIPARVRKPKDKSKAEIGVQLVQRWISAALRDRIFISLDHLNAEISRLLEELNKKPFKKLPGNRLQRFNSLEKQALKELPSHPYEFAHWRRLRVGRDYHIGVIEHFCSVPHKHAGQMVDVRFNNKTMEVFSRNERIAVHPRATTEGQTTIREHMPTNHQKYAGWNPRELCHWASEQGRHIHEIFQAIMADPERNHHQRIRCCVGLMQLSRGYDNERFEGACRHALKFQALTYRSIQSILKNRLDQQSEADAEDIPVIQHPNIRGSRYYT